MLYADYNAARPPYPKILAAFYEAEQQLWGNPSSPHHIGRLAKRAIEDARSAVASLLSAQPSEIVFTSGASEANFLALSGALPKGASLLLARTEHPSVLSAAELLQQKKEKVLWAQTPHQLIDEIRRSRPGLVSVMLAQNETGEIFPVRAIADEAKRVGALVHCDAVQAIGRVEVSCSELGVDLLSLSGRKLCGVGASGALFVRRGVALSPLMPGSSEAGRRAGTLSAASLVALGLTAKLSREIFATTARHAFYKEQLLGALRAKIPELQEAATGKPCLSNTIHILLPGCDGEDLVTRLDAAGICVSTGAACTSGTKRPSHVLLAMGYTPEEARTSLRISIGPETTQQEIEQLSQMIPPLYQESREALQ